MVYIAFVLIYLYNELNNCAIDCILLLQYVAIRVLLGGEMCGLVSHVKHLKQLLGGLHSASVVL